MQACANFVMRLLAARGVLVLAMRRHWRSRPVLSHNRCVGIVVRVREVGELVSELPDCGAEQALLRPGWPLWTPTAAHQLLQVERHVTSHVWVEGDGPGGSARGLNVGSVVLRVRPRAN